MGLESGKDVEYKSYTLGDVGVIELLISYRYKYDENLFLDSGTAMAVTGAARLNEEVIATYVTLDETIKRCKFSEQQIEMMRLIGEGYSYEEIASMMKINLSAIAGRLNTVYKRIHKENEWQWRKSVYIDKLNLMTKRCSKCREDLPGTVEFYSDDYRNKDGFHSMCKMCR